MYFVLAIDTRTSSLSQSAKTVVSVGGGDALVVGLGTLVAGGVVAVGKGADNLFALFICEIGKPVGKVIAIGGHVAVGK